MRRVGGVGDGDATGVVFGYVTATPPPGAFFPSALRYANGARASINIHGFVTVPVRRRDVKLQDAHSGADTMEEKAERTTARQESISRFVRVSCDSFRNVSTSRRSISVAA